jgi:peptidoglycan/xylan/chitin deacetylase (PgdA/CDA1 family)
MHAIRKGWYGCIRRNGEPLGRYELTLEKDILKAQNKIFMMTGRLPQAFTYPYGSYCADTDILLKKLAFRRHSAAGTASISSPVRNRTACSA